MKFTVRRYKPVHVHNRNAFNKYFMLQLAKEAVNAPIWFGCFISSICIRSHP